jgi:LacI family transcriptional regulator
LPPHRAAPRHRREGAPRRLKSAPLQQNVPNLDDVARAAGVSAMTVSRSFNRPQLVHPETRARVLEVARQMGYVPNEAARSLVYGRTNTIALILPDIRNPFFTNVARGVEDVAKRHGYVLMLGNTDEDPGEERHYIDSLSARRVDGVILSTAGDGHVELLQQRQIPVVLFDRAIPGVEADLVRADVFDAGRRLILHLAEQGYRRVAFVGGPEGISTLETRLAGCRQAALEADVELDVHLGRFDQSSGDEIVSGMCARAEVPEAIVGANNLVAVGALVALRRAGLRVPDDVGLACFGELELASLIDPFLTVIQDPEYETGRVAMQMLHRRITGFSGPCAIRILPVELIPRRSTQRPT